jgi:hypothetical protein
MVVRGADGLTLAYPSLIQDACAIGVEIIRWYEWKTLPGSLHTVFGGGFEGITVDIAAIRNTVVTSFEKYQDI